MITDVKLRNLCSKIWEGSVDLENHFETIYSKLLPFIKDKNIDEEKLQKSI